MPENIGPQRFADLKVETDSGQGGKIFMVRRKLFQGRVERFSWLGGNFFRVRWKDFRGKEETFSG